MTTDDSPKSAVELAMERLRQRDADSGVTGPQITEAQKAAIAEARNLHGSRIAELEILYRSQMAAVFDPQARAQREDEYRRDVQRLNDELERKIEKIRAAGD